MVYVMYSGGQRGIRTLDRLAPIHAFQACAFNHSATCPSGGGLWLSPPSGATRVTARQPPAYPPPQAARLLLPRTAAAPHSGGARGAAAPYIHASSNEVSDGTLSNHAFRRPNPPWPAHRDPYLRHALRERQPAKAALPGRPGRSRVRPRLFLGRRA